MFFCSRILAERDIILFLLSSSKWMYTNAHPVNVYIVVFLSLQFYKITSLLILKFVLKIICVFCKLFEGVGVATHVAIQYHHDDAIMSCNDVSRKANKQSYR